MDAINELAKMFTERNNKETLGIQIGKVVSPHPELKVSLGDSIILDKRHLVIAAHVLDNYERAYELEYTEDVTGDTNGATVGTFGSHFHTLKNLMVKGKLKWTDTLKKDDEVILIPTADNQRFVLIDRAVKL
jgi:hypothetical protein